MSSAAPTSGQSRPVAALAATMASRSIISMAAGRIPAAMIRETASPPSSVEGKVAKKVRVASGLRSSRSVTSVTMPSIPSLPTSAASRSWPGESRAVPPMSTTLPSCRTRRAPSTWFAVNPYLRQWAPPAFSARLPPMEQMLWEDGSGA
jgi:hypothetical protein